MRVLLIQPPLEDFYTTAIRLYPLGLAYAAGVLRQMGVTVGIFDCLNPLRKRELALPNDFRYLKPFLQKTPFFFRHYYRFGLPDEAVIRAISDFAPDMVGIASQFTAYFQTVAQLAALVKDHTSVPVFVGGNHASVFAAEIRRRAPQIDAILTGPAEASLPAFMAGRLRDRPPTLAPLDWHMVVPAHDLLPAGRYRIGRKNYASMTASRGCPYGCDFCSVQSMFGRRIDYRAVQAVIGEMEWNYLNREVRIFNFEDDNLSFDREWFKQLLIAVGDHPVLKGIELTAMNGICYANLDEPLLALMRRSGFRRLNLSFVSRSNRLRQRHHRPESARELEVLIRAAQNMGFMLTVYVIIGLPDQTYDEVRASIDYLLGLGVLVGPSPFYLPPGSALYGRMKLPESIRRNWNLYRSTAFAVETEHLDRDRLVALFSYARGKNLEKKTAVTARG